MFPCTVVTWVSKPNGIQITIYGEIKKSPNAQFVDPWVGVGFSKSGTMADADMYFCKNSKNRRVENCAPHVVLTKN